MSTEFSWLDGLYDWYEESPLPGAIDAVGDYGRDVLTGYLGQYTQPIEQRIPGQIDAALTVGQNLANTIGSGFLALPRLQQGVGAYTDALRHAQGVAGRQASTPMGQYYMDLLGTATAPVAALEEELGERGYQAGGPVLGAAGQTAPTVMEMLFGAGALRGARPRQLGVEDLFPDPSRIEGPAPSLFEVRGVSGRGGPRARQEGAVRVSGDPDRPRYGELEGENLSPREQLIRRADNPEGRMVSSIPLALDDMSRQKPGPGNAWYNALMREGVTPEEMRFFGLDSLKGNETNMTKEEVAGLFEQSKNDIEAWRASSTGNIQPYRPETNEAAQNTLQGIRADYPDRYSTDGDALRRDTMSMRDALIERGVPADDAAMVADQTNMLDLNRYANAIMDNNFAGLNRINVRELRSELDWQRDRSGNPEAFNEVYADYINLLERSQAYLEEIGPSRADAAREMRISGHTPAYEDYSRIPGDLSRGITRYHVPSSEYGDVLQKDYGADIFGPVGLIREGPRDKHPDEWTANEKAANELARMFPDYVGMPGYGNVLRSNMHYAAHSRAPMLRAGSEPLTVSHERPSRRALYPESLEPGGPHMLFDDEGNLQVETVNVAEELQSDAMQQHHKWGLAPGMPTIKQQFDPEVDQAGMDDLAMQISDLKRQLADKKERIQELDAQMYSVPTRQAQQDLYDEIDQLRRSRRDINTDISYLNNQLQAMKDAPYAGTPDLPFKQDREWKKFMMKNTLMDAIEQGDEWATMPVPWSSAKWHQDLEEAKGISYDPSYQAFKDERGNILSDEMVEQFPPEVQAEAIEAAKNAKQDYSQEDYVNEHKPKIREALEKQAEQRYHHIEPAVKVAWAWERPIDARLMSPQYYRTSYRDDPDRGYTSMVQAVADVGGTPVKEYRGGSLEELREEYVDTEMAGINTPNEVHRMLRRLGMPNPRSYGDVIRDKVTIPHEARWVSNKRHRPIWQHAERDLMPVLEDVLRDLGFRYPSEHIEMIPIQAWNDRVEQPAIRISDEVKQRAQAGMPLFNILPGRMDPKTAGGEKSQLFREDQRRQEREAERKAKRWRRQEAYQSALFGDRMEQYYEEYGSGDPFATSTRSRRPTNVTGENVRITDYED